MDNKEFRIYHANLIEQYQMIEHDLEGLYGLLDKGSFDELTKRVENDTMGELIRKVRFLIKECKENLLSSSDFDNLENIRNDRNYWCHSCYLDLLKDNSIFNNLSDRLKDDYTKAYNMNLKLRNVFKRIKS